MLIVKYMCSTLGHMADASVFRYGANIPYMHP